MLARCLATRASSAWMRACFSASRAASHTSCRPCRRSSSGSTKAIRRFRSDVGAVLSHPRLLGLDARLLLGLAGGVPHVLQALQAVLLGFDQGNQAFLLGDNCLAERLGVLAGILGALLDLNPRALEAHAGGVGLLVTALVLDLDEAGGLLDEIHQGDFVGRRTDGDGGALGDGEGGFGAHGVSSNKSISSFSSHCRPYKTAWKRAIRSYFTSRFRRFAT